MAENEKILIVEDEGIIAREINARLKKMGYEVVGIADNGEDAYNKAIQQKPDLIMMDINIKGDLDGIQTARKILNDYEVPVIFLTAHTDDRTLERAKMANPYGYVVKPFQEQDLKIRLEMAFQRSRYERQSRKSLEESARAMEKESETDSLTGIANRKKFDSYLSSEWKRASRSMAFIGLVMMDIDYFKNYNDHYGHLAGDECLRQVAQAVANCLQREEDLAARYGGEEFAVILPNTDGAGALEVAEKIRKAVENLLIPHEKSLAKSVVTLSLGACSLIPESGSEMNSIIKSADEALYKAKQTGRNRVVKTECLH